MSKRVDPERFCRTDEQRAYKKRIQFGDWLNGEIGRRSDLSANVIAEWLGVTRQAVYPKLKGETEWRLEEFMIICKKMKLPPEEIYFKVELDEV